MTRILRQNKISAAAFTLALTFAAWAPQANAEQVGPAKESQMLLKKLTPVLLAHDVDACVAFWHEFGLEATMTVPGQDHLSFAILTNGQVEVMYQSFESAGASTPAAVEGVNRSVIYLETDSLDKILTIAKKHEVVAPEHTTPYGAREIYIRDPAGNLIGFAEHGHASE